MAKQRQLLFDDERWRGALFSSKRGDWETPQTLYDALNAEFHFTVDVCAVPETAKCKRFFTPVDDGLKQTWTGVVWMNPPYGRDIGRWVKKAFESAIGGATCVCLLPVRTDTKWWHEFIMKAEVRFIRGRLQFGNATTSAPFPSAIVVFRPGAVAALPPKTDGFPTLFDVPDENHRDGESDQKTLDGPS